MERKLDFIIDDNSQERLLFRFYPRQSHCHGFGEKCPRTWKEVYKVYYSWAIIKQYKENDKVVRTKIMYKDICDECSCIGEVSEFCHNLAKDIEIITTEKDEKVYLLNNEIFPFGMGTSWRIEKKDYSWLLNGKDIRYKFFVFSYNDIGFRFTLNKDRIKEFGDFLNHCCEYMLKHSEPI